MIGSIVIFIAILISHSSANSLIIIMAISFKHNFLHAQNPNDWHYHNHIMWQIIQFLDEMSLWNINAIISYENEIFCQRERKH